MRDWEQLVRDRLARGKQRAAVEPEVAEELAHHLEDVCEAGLQLGLSEEDSVDRAWAEVKNWPRLARKINQARGGNEMLKQRIYRLWLPGIVTMTVAMGILCAGLRASLQPRMMEISPKISVFMYLAWLLLILPALGALAGYWSRRAGGSVGNRAAAALFTALTMLAICSTVLILEVPADHGMKAPGIFTALLSSTLGVILIGGMLIGGMLLPAVALLAGAWPFLRDTRRVALFTALTMLAIYLVVLIHAVFADDHMKASGVFTDLISSIIGGILLPATALLIGALPFLRESSSQRHAADDDLRAGTA